MLDRDKTVANEFETSLSNHSALAEKT